MLSNTGASRARKEELSRPRTPLLNRAYNLEKAVVSASMVILWNDDPIELREGDLHIEIRRLRNDESKNVYEAVYPATRPHILIHSSYIS